MKYYVGIDIGGTNIKFGIFDSKKNLLDKFSKQTIISNKEQEKKLIEYVLENIKNYFDEHKINTKNILGIGWTFPGPVARGKVLRAVNINWKKPYNIENAVNRFFKRKIRITLQNDANAALRGEAMVGFKGKYKDSCLITIGTAIGMGFMIDGHVIEGNNGIAGELCHLRIDYSSAALPCNCGNKGCLETIVSAKAILNYYNKCYPNKKLDSTKAVFDLAKKGDRDAYKIVEDRLKYLAFAMVIMVHIYDPEAFFIGGGVSNNGKIITDILSKYVKKNIYITKKMPKIMLAKLKNDAGIYGAIIKL